MAQKMYISEATLRNSAAQTKKINLADKAWEHFEFYLLQNWFNSL